MLRGCDTVDYVLTQEQIPQSRYKIIHRMRGILNTRVKYRINSTAKFYLFKSNYDGHEIDDLESAFHETGHFVSNNSDPQRFMRFRKWQIAFAIWGLIGLFFSLVTLIFTFVPRLYGSPLLLIIEFVVSNVGIYITQHLAPLYKVEEELADQTALRLISQYIGGALVRYNDTRNSQQVLSSLQNAYSKRHRYIKNSTDGLRYIGYVCTGFAIILAVFWFLIRR